MLVSARQQQALLRSCQSSTNTFRAVLGRISTYQLPSVNAQVARKCVSSSFLRGRHASCGEIPFNLSLPHRSLRLFSAYSSADGDHDKKNNRESTCTTSDDDQHKLRALATHETCSHIPPGPLSPVPEQQQGSILGEKEYQLGEEWSRSKINISDKSQLDSTGNVVVEAGERTGVLASPKTTTQAYLSLSKARLSGMVVATAAAGFLAAPFEPSMAMLLQFSLACVGTGLASGGANTFNQIIETAHDARMARTKKRALPAGQISTEHAIAFGTIISTAGTSLLYFTVNPTAALLAASNIALYAGLYTPSKRWTVWNTWIGAFVGALPPMIGWAAATGGHLGAGALALGTVLYVWQLPHFLALSWGIKQDYFRAGYQMLSAVSPEKVPLQTLLWTAAFLPLGGLCTLAGITTPLFALDSAVISSVLLYQAKNFYDDESARSARKLFMSTLWWLPLFIVLMLLHKRRWSNHREDMAAEETESTVQG